MGFFVFLMVLVALGLIVYGAWRGGKHGKIDLGELGKFNGPGLVVLGIGCLVVAAVMAKAGF